MVDRPIRLQDAQWAAIRAGYPYPVDQIIVGDVDVDQFKDLLKMLQTTAATRLGVVRVRIGAMDRWVVLFSNDGPLTEGFSRELAVGEELTVEGEGQYQLIGTDRTCSTRVDYPQTTLGCRRVVA